MNQVATTMKQKLIDKLLAMGYEPDPRGNLLCSGTQRMHDGRLIRRKYRVKFQDISVRLEIQGTERHPVFKTLPWLRLTSCYYSQIVDCGDGRLKLGSTFIGSRTAIEVIA